MKFTAKYLDSGFYLISDKAAGAISKGKLPKIGHQLINQSIKVEDIINGVVLQRTPTSSLNKRGWSWSIHRVPYVAGGKFKFEA